MGFFSSIKKAASSLGSGIKKAASSVASAAKKAASSVASAAKKAASSVASAAKSVATKVASVASTVADKAKSVAKIVGTNIKNSFSKESLLAFAKGFAQGGLVGAIAQAGMTTAFKSMAELDPKNFGDGSEEQAEAEAELNAEIANLNSTIGAEMGVTFSWSDEQNAVIGVDNATGAICIIGDQVICEPSSVSASVAASSTLPVASASVASVQQTQGIATSAGVVSAKSVKTVSSWKSAYNASTSQLLASVK